MANTLMFEVGVKEAGTQISDLEKKLDALVAKYGTMKIAVEISNLDTFVNALKSIGNGEQLKPLLDRIQTLQNRLGALGDKGQYFDMLRGNAAAAAKEVERAEKYLVAMQKTGNSGFIASAKDSLQRAQVEATRANEMLASAMERVAKEEKNTSATSSELRTKIDAVGQSVSDLQAKLGNGIHINLDTSKFGPLTEQIQNLVGETSDLITQLKTLSQVQSQPANDEAIKTQTKDVENLSKAKDKLTESNKKAADSQASDESTNKVTNTYERYQRLLLEIENQMAAIGKIQLFGEQSGFSPTILKKAVDEFEKLKTIVDATIKGKPIAEGLTIPMTPEQLSQFVAQFSLLKTAYKDIVSEADKFNKQSERDFANAQKTVQSEIDKTISKLKALDESIKRGEASGRDMSVLSDAQSKLKGQLGILQKMTNSDYADSKIVEKRISSIRQLREDTENLRKVEEKLTSAREKLNKAKDKDDTKRLNDEIKSLNEAWIKYNELTAKIKELESLRDRGIKANIDITQIDSAIARYHDLKVAMMEIINNDGRNLRGNLTSQVWGDHNTKKSMQDAVADAKAYTQSLNDVEKRMQRAATVAEGLGKRIDSLEAKKVDFKDIDTTRLDNAVRRIKDIRDELERFSQTGKSTYGVNADEIVRKMGLAAAIKDVNTQLRESSIEAGKAAASNSRLSASEQQLANSIKHSTDSMRSQSQVLGDLKTLATQYLGVWGAQGFLRNVIEIGGQLEMQRLSIGAILGDMAKASELFDRIKNLAVKSPFGVVELDQMTKQLSAYGFEYPELFDMTKRLADISAATGTSVDRLALALGHVRSEAALSGYTLRQFSMANIPLARKLSEELTKVEGKFVSVADVRKRVRTKDIGYEPVLKVLKDLTDEGGMFYNAQEIMSESVKARFKNLKDSMDIMYGEIAESKVGKSLKSVASLLTVLTRHWQELGAVLVVGAGYWAVSRLAVLASNKAMVQGNLTMGRFTAAQLEMQAQTGNLTRAQLLQAVATKKLAVADAEAAGAVLSLSRAQLQHVANTGKVASAMNMATIATSKYTVSQLRFLATMRGMNLGWLGTGLLGISNGFQAARVAALGFMKAMWPMLAISAIVEVFMNLKRESESFAEAANYVGQSARNMMKDINEAMNSVSRNGKPVDAESLREAVNTMKEVLEANEFYTAEQQEQVEKAVTLSEKYDVLLKQMKEMREEAEWQANSEGLVEKILANTGKNIVTRYSQKYNPQTGDFESGKQTTDFGMPFFNNSLQENIEQVNKSNSALQSAIFLLSEYQGVMKEAIDKNNGFGLSLDGKSWQEQIRLIAQSEHWDKFIASVENAGSRFEKTAANVKTASDKVVEDWESIVGDDVKAIRLTLMKEWGMTEDELNQFAKNNEQTMRWLVDAIAKSLNKLGVAETIIDEFKQKLLSLFGVAGSSKPTQREKTEYEKQTDLGKRLMRNVLNYNKNNGKGGNGVTTVKEINEITGTGDNQKTVVEVTKTLKERAQKSLENMKETKKIYGEASKEYKDAKKKFDHDLNIAQSNGITEAEIRSGKYKDKSGSKTDENAKAVREEMRIMKKSADAFQYWREKVGDDAAWVHVEEEFGDVLARIGVTAKNVNDLRGNIEGLTPKIKKIKDKKVQDETYNEQANELAQLNRKDFEKNTEEFLSKTQLQLDSLTRSWETFNSVRDATGNIKLAVQLSGAGYQEGKTINLADALRKKIEGDFAAAGAVAIPFDINFSDEEIFNRISAAMPEKTQDQIKGIVEEYKKWRDLQRDIYKQGISTISQLLGSAQDYETVVGKINTSLAAQKEAIDRMEKPDDMSDDEWAAVKARAKALADAKAQNDIFKLSTEYINLMNHSLGMTSESIRTAAEACKNELGKNLKDNVITAEQYAEEMAKIEKIMSDFKANGLFGRNSDLISFIKGGTQGLASRYTDQLAARRTELANQGKSKEEIENDAVVKHLKDLRSGLEDFANGLNSAAAYIDFATGILQGFGDAARNLSDMFDALGHESSANTWSDISDNIGAITSGLQSLSSGMKAGANGDIGGVISGVVGAVTSPITAFAQLHDKGIQREVEAIQKNIEALEANTNSIRAARERTLGYDNGDLRRAMSGLYEDTMKNITIVAGKDFTVSSAAKKAMQDYYNAGTNKTGYAAELENLKEMRANYLEMYDKENSKKKSSQDALDEYEKKIAELDEQIMFFVEDLANELWGIDFKAWASQISDALWTAFENGESALDAFHDAARDIISDVAKRMMNIHLIEPVFQQLEERLFGKMENGQRVGGAAYNYDTGKFNEKETLEILGDFFGDDGEFAKVISSAEDFYNMAKAATGFDFGEDSEGNGRSSSTISKSITEEQSNLLIALVNTIRADVSVNRTMIAQYFPLYYQTLTSSNETLGSIAMNTRAIMESNATIAQRVSNLDDSINGLKNKVWRLPVS